MQLLYIPTSRTLNLTLVIKANCPQPPVRGAFLPSSDLWQLRELFIIIENARLDIFISVFPAFDKCYPKQLEAKTKKLKDSV